MTKHTLLPDNYQDSITKTAILFALKPYTNPGSGNMSNPHMRWDLHKAWGKAEDLLPHSRWRYIESLAFDPETAEYALSAYTDTEVERMNIVIAGIVAYQIMNPEEGIFLQRVEHKKGGETMLVISHSAAEALKKILPAMTLAGKTHEEEKPETPFVGRSILSYFKFGGK